MWDFVKVSVLFLKKKFQVNFEIRFNYYFLISQMNVVDSHIQIFFFTSLTWLEHMTKSRGYVISLFHTHYVIV